jgi:hypothetical protein
VLIPKNAEHAQFRDSRIFAAVYPEAVEIAALITAPSWRRLAAGSEDPATVVRARDRCPPRDLGGRA